jgi:hypothetical protein
MIMTPSPRFFVDGRAKKGPEGVLMPMTPSPRFFVDRKPKKGPEGLLMPKAGLCQSISQIQKSVVDSSNKQPQVQYNDHKYSKKKLANK